MDQTGHKIDQKRAKKFMNKGKKIEFSDLKKTCFLADFSLAELWGTPFPPLTENHPAQKPLAEMGVPPPLYRKKSAK